MEYVLLKALSNIIWSSQADFIRAVYCGYLKITYLRLSDILYVKILLK